MADDTEAEDVAPEEAPAEEAEEVDGDDGAEDGEGGGKKRSKKKLILMIAVPVLVLLLGGGGAAFFLMGGEEPAEQTAAADGEAVPENASGGGGEEATEGASDSDQVEGEGEGAGKRPEGAAVFYAASGLVFYDLPDMIVNLNSTSRQSRYLKIKVALEFGDPKVVDQIETVMPRIIDHFQVYLRELREDDLRGSAGLYRLKEELMIRVNQALRPAKIRDVLFKEMLVQ